MSAPDLETKSRRLFAGTCELLGLKPEQLTLAQRLRVSRASALRLQIDDLEKAQLLGQPIDIKQLVEASEALERLVNTTPNGDGSGSDKWEKARIEFEALIGLHLHTAGNEPKDTSEAPTLREENTRLREENFKLKVQLTELTSTKSMPQPTPTKQPDNNVVPMPMPMSGVERANSTKPPSHYLKQPPEPWEEFYSGRR
jgi:hypothetical protein